MRMYRFRYTEIPAAPGKLPLRLPLTQGSRPSSAIAITVEWGMHHFGERAFAPSEFLSDYQSLFGVYLGKDFPPPTSKARLRARLQRMYEEGFLEIITELQAVPQVKGRQVSGVEDLPSPKAPGFTQADFDSIGYAAGTPMTVEQFEALNKLQKKRSQAG